MKGNAIVSSCAQGNTMNCGRCSSYLACLNACEFIANDLRIVDIASSSWKQLPGMSKKWKPGPQEWDRMDPAVSYRGDFLTSLPSR